MLDNTAGEKPQAKVLSGRIEGGLDAIVSGATVDGYAAAGVLARSGYKTVLLEGQANVNSFEEREIAPGFRYTPGAEVTTHIDPALIDSLELYKHGLRYRQRRLKTIYHFDEQQPVTFLSELLNSKSTDEYLSEIDAQKLADFTERLSQAARKLRPTFYNGEVPRDLEPEIDRLVMESSNAILSDAFEDPRISTAILAETHFGAAVSPSDPQSFLALVYKMSGEVSGYQGARGYLDGGILGLKAALRRACQSFGVSFRGVERVKKVLVEWDHVAGVELEDGSQLRAPVVVATESATKALAEHIGRERLSIELEHSLKPVHEKIGSLEVGIAVTGIESAQSIDSMWLKLSIIHI